MGGQAGILFSYVHKQDIEGLKGIFDGESGAAVKAANTLNEFGETAATFAASEGLVEVVKVFLQRGLDLSTKRNAAKVGGFTLHIRPLSPLTHCPILPSYPPSFLILIPPIPFHPRQTQLSPLTFDSFHPLLPLTPQETPLMSAVSNGQLSVVRLFCAPEDDVKHMMTLQPPGDDAADGAYMFDVIIRRLILNTSNNNSTANNTSGTTATNSDNSTAITATTTTTTNIKNTTNSNNKDKLITLDNERDEQMLSLLLASDRYKSALTNVDANGNTPLHTAAAAGSAYVVSLLLANGADKAALDAKGQTALHVACGCDLALVRVLLDCPEGREEKMLAAAAAVETLTPAEDDTQGTSNVPNLTLT